MLTNAAAQASDSGFLDLSGYRSRVSDILNEGSQFLALTDVTVREAGASATATSTHYDVILVRKGDIVFVESLS